jgi:hypothetical protein
VYTFKFNMRVIMVPEKTDLSTNNPKNKVGLKGKLSGLVVLFNSRLDRKISGLIAIAVASVGILMIASSSALTTPNSSITVNGDGGDRTFNGVGAILAGGDNNRYLIDYPQAQRTQMLNDLFKPNYGASLQMLKVEIGGDDGGEASIEPAKGQINCNAGYGLSIAQQAVAINPNLQLYGLQWGAPGWVGDGTNTVFTNDDIQYLLDWLSCTKQYGLHINYLGGWNESDDGTHAAWYHSLREALDANGYTTIRRIRGNTRPRRTCLYWERTIYVVSLLVQKVRRLRAVSRLRHAIPVSLLG